MQVERIKNAKRNMIFGFVNRIVSLFFPFLLRAFLIKEIGAEFLGLSSLFASILQVLNLTELGFSSAIVFCLYKPIAQNDEDTINAILNFYRKVYLIIGIFIFSAGCIISPFLKYLIKGDIPTGVNIYILFFIYLINTVLSYVLFGYKSTILGAYQRNDIISNINTVVSIFVYISQTIIILHFKNFYLYVLCNLIATFIINISVQVATKRLFPNLVCRGSISKELKLLIREKISGLMIAKLTGISRNAFDSIFLSLFLGLIETAKYNNYYLIMSSVSGLILIIFNSISAGVGNSVAIETEEKNFKDLQKFNFLYMWIAGWCSVCLLCLYQPFIQLFFGSEMLFPYSTVILFVLYFYLLRVGDILCVYSDANGLWWKSRYITISEGVCNLLLNYLLGKRFGVNGIIAGTFISLLLTTNSLGAFVTFKYYFTHQNIFEYFFKHMIYLLVSTIVAFICFFLCNLIKDVTLFTFIFRCVICLIVPNVLYVLFYFWTKTFKDALIWIKTKVLKNNKLIL